MAYDGSSELYVKTDVFSVAGLAAWLETQDGATEYEYLSNENCLVCRYLLARNVPAVRVSSLGWRDANHVRHSLPFAFDDVAVDGPWTYAAALDRCRALLAEGQQ